MNESNQVSHLIGKWDEHRAQGKEVTPEELCCDFPELLPEVKKKIAAIEAVEDKFPVAQSTVGEATGDYVPAERRSQLPRSAGRYRIQQEIARGGMGVVLRAVDPDFDRPLAVKIMLEAMGNRRELERRFFAEARITGRLQHPGIAPVHEMGRLDDGRPFFAMKLIEGNTLAALLKKRSRRDAESGGAGIEKPADGAPWDMSDLPRFIGIFEQICQTLAYAHSHGVIHRDVKPANIMVGAFGEVQVMDWGLAKKIQEQASPTAGETQFTADASAETSSANRSESLTRDGVVMGTPAYMSPEQARGEIDQLDERSDVFGLGAILCVILTDKPPYYSESGKVLSLARKGDLTHAITLLDSCGADPELIGVCKSCLANSKEDRPRNASEVALAVTSYQESVEQKRKQAELERAQAEVQVVEERKLRKVEEAKAQEERKRRRWTLATAAALLLGLSAVGIGTVLYLQDQAARTARHTQTEQSIRESYEKARGIRVDLRKRLVEPGGVFRALNEPVRWQATIKEAQSILGLAKERASGAERPIQAELRQSIDDLHALLREDENDRKRAQRLEEIHAERSQWTDVSFDTAGSLEAYSKVFQAAGLKVNDSNVNALVKQIKTSAIREQLVAALDDWAYVARVTKRNNLQKRLLVIAQLAGTDDLRNQLRNPKIWRDGESLRQLAVRLAKNQRALKGLSPQWRILMANLLRSNKLDSIQWLRQAHKAQPDEFWLNFTLALSLERSEKPLEAAGYYRAALATRPTNSAAWNNLGNLLLATNDLEEALHAYLQAVEFGPRNSIAWGNLGSALRNQKKHPGMAKTMRRAIETLQLAVKTDPKFARGWANLGRAYLVQDDIKGATAAYKEAVKHAGKDAIVWQMIADFRYDRFDLRGAVSACDKALAINPKLVDLWIILGMCRNELGDNKGAVAAYKSALKINPKNEDVWNNLGNALRQLGEFTEAMQAYNKSLKYNPKSAITWNNIGITYHRQKKTKKEIAAYRTALKYNPQYAKAWWNLGQALLSQNDISGATSAFTKAALYSPSVLKRPVENPAMRKREDKQSKKVSERIK